MASPDATGSDETGRAGAPDLDFHGLTPPGLPDLRLGAMFARARAETGRRWWEILRDFAPLQAYPNRLLLIEYFGYRLFDWERVGPEDRRRFVGFLGQRAINRRLNRGARPPGLWGDKLLFDALMRGAGLATPPIRAVFAPGRSAPGAVALGDADAIAAWLRAGARYPLFGKPVRGEQSRGIASLDAYDAGADRLLFQQGAAMGVEAFARAVAEETRADGYLFQDRLAPHPEIADVSAGGLNTVRFVTVTAGGRTEILYAVWKIAAPGSPTDDGLFPGALKGWLDAETGTVLRVQKGAWIDHQVLTHHPDTGAALVGRRIPCWAEARAAALAAAALAPSFRILGWDVAITPEGPVLVEGNGDPGHRVAQTASGQGALTDRFRALMAEIEAEERARARMAGRRGRARRRAFRSALIRKLARDLLGWGRGAS